MDRVECEFFQKGEINVQKSDLFLHRVPRIFFTGHYFVSKMDRRLLISIPKACYAVLVVIIGHNVDARDPEIFIGPVVE